MESTQENAVVLVSYGGNRALVPRWAAGVAVVTGLLVLLCAAVDLRTRGMLPPDRAVSYQWDYDEGVHLQAAQLMLQGSVPYRDFLYLQPPFSLVLFGAVLKLHWVPWGDAVAFAFERYAAIGLGLLTVIGVFAAASRLGGWLSGLLSAGLLALDATVIQTDRQAMLEPYANALSIIAILLCLVAFGRGRTRRLWFGVAGAVGALAGLTKTSAAVVLAAILIYLFGRLLVTAAAKRFWGQVAPLSDSWRIRFGDFVAALGGAVIVAAGVTGYFIATCPAEFTRQVYLFHFVRPTDGTVQVAQRFTDLVNSLGSHLTISVAVAGLMIILLRGAALRDWGHWVLVLLWTLGVLALFATSRTFFPHYYSQLMVPLAVMGGGLAGVRVGAISIEPREGWRHSLVPALQIVIAGFVLLANFRTVQAQYAEAERTEILRSMSVPDISRYLATNTPLDAKVLSFQPIYSFAASREPVRLRSGAHLVDSYGYMLYTNVGMEEGLPEANEQGIWDAIHGREAQMKIVEIAEQADYVVIDRQARWALNPETITAITARRRQVFEANKVTVFAEREKPTVQEADP